MEYAEYKKLKEEIETECKNKLEALEIVWRMATKANISNSLDLNLHGGISLAIRKIIAESSTDLSVNYIIEALKAHNINKVNRLVVTNTLYRLARRGEIKVVRKGQGRIASIYRKIKRDESAI